VLFSLSCLRSPLSQETIQEAARVLTSKPAKRAVVNTVLLTAASFVLLFLAAVASALFFQGFVPDQVLSRPVYLQYGYGAHPRSFMSHPSVIELTRGSSGINPYGVVTLKSPALKTAQDYDISVALSMPPTPPNTERGNFMVNLLLLDAEPGPLAAQNFANNHGSFEDGCKSLFQSRRPALVPYVDPLASLASRILLLGWNMLFPNTRSYDMTIPLAERMSFAKGSTLPSAAYIEIESGQTLQTYGVTLTLTAQLSGLRYLMHHYRLPMYVMFTFGFWVAEVVFTGMAWAFLLPMIGSPTGEPSYRLKGESERTKLLEQEDNEGSDFSDHPHSFPTYGRQPPLKHEPEVKKEETDHRRPLSELPTRGAEADDEDDEEDEPRTQRDSGLGTSYSEEGIGGVRRRGSRQ